MNRLIRLRPMWAWILYLALDVLCTGMGMGVPIFCILLGLPVGWYIVQRLIEGGLELARMLAQVWRYAIATAAVTFVGMAILWGMTAPMLFDPAADLANFGIPLILYEPRASFIGWLVLMIFISPFLQFLMALFGAYWALLRSLKGQR
jgi:hypothetical protein